MHLFLSQYWRMVPDRIIPQLSCHLERIFQNEDALPFVCDSEIYVEFNPDVESIPHEVMALSVEWNVSLEHLKVSYERKEQLIALNQQWLILNHIVYLAAPVTEIEWRIILAEYLHRRG